MNIKLDIKKLSVVVLLACSSGLIAMKAMEVINDPSSDPVFETDSFERPDIFNLRLDYLAAVLSPIDTIVPNDLALQYVGQEDYFQYFQAVLAPRRVSPEIESPYVLAFLDSHQSVDGLAWSQGMTVLMKLPDNIAVLKRKPNH